MKKSAQVKNYLISTETFSKRSSINLAKSHRRFQGDGMDSNMGKITLNFNVFQQHLMT